MGEERLKFHYLKAKAAMELKDFRVASEEFLCMTQIAPNLDFSHYNLASCYVELGQWKQAYDHYYYALSLGGELSQDADLLFNLGVCAERLNQPEHAERFYQEASLLNADLFAAHFNLGLLTSLKGKNGLALSAFREAERLNPRHPEVEFHLKRLVGENLPELPLSHVRSLFDGYADHYDQHLQETLNYVLPEIMVDFIAKECGGFTFPLLDLGCGTGLIAEALSVKIGGEIGRIDGVDLSPKMLAVARGKGKYQQLCCEDLITFLRSAPSFSYQGVLAAEVFNYFGDLSDIFCEVSRVLKPGGWLCFSVEQPSEIQEVEGKDWILQPSLRYAHNQSYVKTLTQKEGFEERAVGEALVRNEQSAGVTQRLFLLKRWV
jgi:predicted TPR repeat methyltransferase